MSAKLHLMPGRPVPAVRLGLPALVALALLAGCAERHAITVGSIPDDYRTNHPIMISEKEDHIDLPVGRAENGITRTQQAALEGFMAGYDHSARPVVSVITPAGAANHAAALKAADDMMHVIVAGGVPRHRIQRLSYAASAAETSPPIRVSYTSVKAHTDACGRWPEDLLETPENRHYANFGCASQNNLAAQVANPADLIGPRKQTTIDAENRGAAIDRYKRGAVAEEFTGNSEINY